MGSAKSGKRATLQELRLRGTFQMSRHRHLLPHLVPPPGQAEAEPSGPIPRAPAGLTASSRHWWYVVVKGWKIGPHQLPLLKLACQALGEIEVAREEVAAAGKVIDHRGEPRAHPALRREHWAVMRFAHLMKQLDLK